jgi:hypothetical protein
MLTNHSCARIIIGVTTGCDKDFLGYERVWMVPQKMASAGPRSQLAGLLQRWDFYDAFEKWDGGISGLKNMSGGKVIAIEGELRMYQGNPEIGVRVPAQIQVVK